MQQIRKRYGEKLKRIEKTLHQNPELAFSEVETTRLIREELQKLGFSFIDLSMKTGVVARLAGGHPGKTIGLRADIDGIEQHELVERPDRSKNPDVMHACGHDVHMTGLLGAAMALSDMRQELFGDVVFVFQPAEETIAGANMMIAQGLFDKVELSALFGLHNQPELPVGQVGLKHGVLMAAKDDFAVTVRGRGGHGGIPEKCVDPIVAACSMVCALQSVVSRNVSPRDTAALSVCTFHGGAASNLIPDEARFAGCVRTFDTGVQDLVMKRIYEITDGCARAYGCKAEVDHYATMRPLENSEKLYPVAEAAAIATVGKDGIREPEKCIASEDFAAYGPLIDSYYYFLGSGRPNQENASWHSAHFQADPDTAFYGAALLTNSVLAAQRML